MLFRYWWKKVLKENLPCLWWPLRLQHFPGSVSSFPAAKGWRVSQERPPTPSLSVIRTTQPDVRNLCLRHPAEKYGILIMSLWSCVLIYIKSKAFQVFLRVFFFGTASLGSILDHIIRIDSFRPHTFCQPVFTCICVAISYVQIIAENVAKHLTEDLSNSSKSE